MTDKPFRQHFVRGENGKRENGKRENDGASTYQNLDYKRRVITMNTKKIIAIVLYCAVLILPLSACAQEKETAYPPVSLSDNLFSFELALNGHKYTLPAPYQEFFDNGWEMKRASSMTFEPDEYSDPFQISYNSEEANSGVRLFNGTAETLNGEDCTVGEFTVTSSETSYVPYIELPGGITMKSTYEDVIAAYGEPDEESKAVINTLTYRIDDYKYVEIDINTNTNSVFRVTIANLLSYYEITK